MDPNEDELLSAYLDRELTPDERASVNRLVESDPHARERLRELEVTSRFLQRLPVQSPGADFSDSVMERLQSESLLRPVTTSAKPRKLYPGWWLAGSLAAAASLLVAITLVRLPRNTMEVDFPEPSVTRNLSEAIPSAVVESDMTPWDSLGEGDTLRLFGPDGKWVFDVCVLEKTAQPSSLLCILVRNITKDVEASRGLSRYRLDVRVEPVGLAIQADQNQIEKLEEVLQLVDKETTTTPPVVDILLSQDPQALVMRGIRAQSLAEFVAQPEASAPREASANLNSQTELAVEAKLENSATLGRDTEARSSAPKPPTLTTVNQLAKEQTGVYYAGPGERGNSKLSSLNLEQSQRFKIQRLQVETEVEELEKSVNVELQRTFPKSTTDGVGALADKKSRPFAPGLNKEPPGRVQVLLRFRETDEPSLSEKPK